MTTLDTRTVLDGGAVLTKPGQIVNLELDGDLGLFFMAKVGEMHGTDRAAFGTRQERDEALLRTVRLYLGAGWRLAGDSAR